MKPRGLRNKNPLNLRRTGQLWQGMAASQTDKDFYQFRSMAWGYRAACVVIRTYVLRRKCTTVQAILSRWAPASDDNNEEEYLARVRVLTRFAPDMKVDPFCHDHMVPLISAMSRVENGVPAVPDEVEAGWKLYLG